MQRCYFRQVKSLLLWARAVIGLMILTASGFAQAEWYRYSDTAMTTPIHLEFWAEDQPRRTVPPRRCWRCSTTLIEP